MMRSGRIWRCRKLRGGKGAAPLPCRNWRACTMRRAQAARPSMMPGCGGSCRPWPHNSRSLKDVGRCVHLAREVGLPHSAVQAILNASELQLHRIRTFSILSKQALAHSVQRSKQDLKELLHRFLANYNETCNPFTWTRGPEQLQRIIETTKEYQATHPRKSRRRRAKRKKSNSIKD